MRLQKYFYFLAFMLMVTTYLPLVYNNMPQYFRSHHLWTVIWGVSLLVLQPKIFFNSRMFYIYFYAILLFVFANIFWIGINPIFTLYLFKELYEIVIAASVLTYFYQTKNYIDLARITKWALIFLFITAIMSIVSSAIDPLYARNITRITSFDDESTKDFIMSFRRLGGGTYSTAAVFMCLFPLFIYYYKNIILSWWAKRMIIIFGAVLIFALLGMQLVANVLIATVFLGIALIGVKKIKYSVFFVVVFFMVLNSIPKEKYVDGLLYAAEELTEYEEISFKFTEIAIYIESDGELDEKSRNATATRALRYPLLIKSFMEYPLFGVFSSSNIGKTSYTGGQAHLYWMNKLATNGLFMFILNVFILIIFIRQNLWRFSSQYKFYYFIALFSILSYGFFKVIAGRETWYAFFILLPGMYYLPLLKKQKSIYITKPIRDAVNWKLEKKQTDEIYKAEHTKD